MEKWNDKQMAQYLGASMQEFDVALSQQITRTYVSLLVVQVVIFISVLSLASLLQAKGGQNGKVCNFTRGTLQLR